MLDAETIAIFSSPPVVVAHNDTCVLSGESISAKSRETPVGHIWCVIATRRPLQDALYVVFTQCQVQGSPRRTHLVRYRDATSSSGRTVRRFHSLSFGEVDFTGAWKRFGARLPDSTLRRCTCLVHPAGSVTACAHGSSAPCRPSVYLVFGLVF